VISRTGVDGILAAGAVGRDDRVARRLSSSHNLRVTELSYEAHTTYDVPQQRWQEEAHKIRLDSHTVTR
jgi:hypothetical protein